MPWLSGSFSRFYGATGWQTDLANNIYILASRHDTHDQDMADGVNACITRDNQAKPTASFLPQSNNAYDLGSPSFSWRNIYGILSNLFISYPQTAAELAASVTPVNLYVDPSTGRVDRYLTNTTPGTTDMRSAIFNANAVAAAGGPSISFGPTIYLVGSALTINAPCVFTNGSIIKVASGITVNMNAQPIAPLAKIFDLSAGGGAVIRGSFGAADLIPQWWGVVADGNYGASPSGTDNSAAFQLCLDVAQARSNVPTQICNRIAIPSGIYRLNSQITIGDGMDFVGTGKYSTILFCPAAFADTTGLIKVAGATGNPSKIRGLAVIGQVGGSGGSGIVSTKNGLFMTDIWVAAFTAHPGIIISNTDNFLEDFALELNLYGLQITQTHVNIQHGTTYNNAASGIIVSNNGSAENGRVNITAVRSSFDVASAIIVSGGKRVTITGGGSSHTSGAAAYTTAGIQIDSSSDVIVQGYAAHLGSASTAGAGFLLSNSSSNIQLSACESSNFQDGVRSTAATEVIITGGIYNSNVRRGIDIEGGDVVSITGAHTNNNSNADAGIFVNMSAACKVAVTGCVSNNNKWGLNFALGNVNAFANAVGNITSGNVTAGIVATGAGTLNNVGNF